ncbi:MAG TPA: hemin uptake protein HemP [Lacipirellulaceae bacterium]|nr:hemin uptake protein HemP [Lacipirellulaceae bacterium]
MSSDSQPSGTPDADPAAGDGPRGDAARPFQSDELLAGRSEVWIAHRGDMYRLRLTTSGKLYLTK